MSNRLWPGASLGSGSYALLAIAILFGTLSCPEVGLAASSRIIFDGELDYATFRRAAAQNETVTISQSPGGSGAAALALARVSKVIIDGQCNSACAWSFVLNEGACFTPRASFGFHAAHDPGTGLRMNAATSFWLDSVRPDLRRHLMGLLTSSDLIRLSASDMRRYYADRVCGTPRKIQVATAVEGTTIAAAPHSGRRRDAKRSKPAETTFDILAAAAAAEALMPRQDDVPAVEDGTWEVWSRQGAEQTAAWPEDLSPLFAQATALPSDAEAAVVSEMNTGDRTMAISRENAEADTAPPPAVGRMLANDVNAPGMTPARSTMTAREETDDARARRRDMELLVQPPSSDLLFGATLSRYQTDARLPASSPCYSVVGLWVLPTRRRTKKDEAPAAL